MIQPNSLILAAGLLVSLTLVVALCFVLIRLFRHETNQTVHSGEPQSKRAPLKDIGPEDIALLAEHPALTHAFLRELRRERRKVLREYLRSLRRDFDQACADIRAAMVASCEDRPDLVSALLKEQLRFKMGLLRAECSMTLEAVGLRSLDFDGVIDALGIIRLNLKQLTATAQDEPI